MEAVRNIGKVELKEMERRGEGLLEGFTEDVSSNGVYKNCLNIVFEDLGDKVVYKGIELSQYDSSDKKRYLYRSGRPRGADITPTSKLVTVETTFNNKIIRAIKEAIEYANNKYEEEKKQMVWLYETINQNSKLIKEDLENKSNIPKREGNCFVTVSIDTFKGRKYIGDFQLFRDKIIFNALKNFRYSKASGDVYKDKAVCSLCIQKKKEIYGLASPFPFYTIDKIGYIAGGFDYGKAWRNFPVCKQCTIELELGKRYLDNNLLFPFYGRIYYLIPKPINETDMKSILTKYLSLKSDDVKAVKGNYAYAEERVMSYLGKESNFISFDLMFIERNNAALNILLNIEDVAPSRFRRIFDDLDKIRAMDFFKDKPVSFEMLNLVFDRGNHNRYFLDTIDRIISDRKLDYKFLMAFLNDYIIDAFKRYERGVSEKGKDSFYRATFRVFGFLYFMTHLNLFESREGEIGMSIENKVWDIKDYQSKRELYQAFFNEAKPFFERPDRKAVFMTGLLAKRLLNIQFKRENRKPFMARLKGLKLNKKDIKRLFWEIQDKLSEYKSEFYSEEFNILSELMLESNELCSISDRDIPFYFSLGMSMSKSIKTSKNAESDYEIEEDVEEN